MEWQKYGDRGVLLSRLPEGFRAKLIERFERALPNGCHEFVIGYDSILLIGSVAKLLPWAKTLRRNPLRAGHETAYFTNRASIEIPVTYDGPDLEATARQCGITEAELIEIHSAPTYSVRMMGFAPGFPYLEGLDPLLHLERRSSPRNHIKPGTVAIGGPHAGIYSVGSPGGWYLLGKTVLSLFNPEAAKKSNPDPASVFTLKPGDRVRFRPVESAHD